MRTREPPPGIDQMACHSKTALVLVAPAMMLAMLPAAGVAEAAPDLPAPFVYLSEIDPRIQQDMRYASENNFLGRVVDGYAAAQCILTRETALSLKKVEDALLKKNYSLKVYDCYRPARGVRDFVRWSRSDGDQKMKPQYYPDYDKDELFNRGFIASHSMHSRGNTVDLTIVPAGSAVPEFNAKSALVRCDAPADRRSPDNSLDFGTGFDCFGAKSHTASEKIPQAAQDNRQMLVDAMAAEGFRNYPREWWHFQKRGAAMDEEFDFPIRAPEGHGGR
jgi:D-alanyl-D-alanine dipeptidase